MKICVAQTRSVKGDVSVNIEHHKKLIALAVSNGADTIIFPELSLTGYEAELAKELATHPDDARFEAFQNLSDVEGISIGVGMPLQTNSGILIGMILYQPNLARKTYHKQYLHADEDPYFINGQKQEAVWDKRNKIALAICYELSVPEHAERAYQSGAKIYIASVAKSAAGSENAINTLSAIASGYAMTVLMSNCVGWCDGIECGGKTSAWNDKGILVGQLNDIDEGILVIDSDDSSVVEKYVI